MRKVLFSISIIIGLFWFVLANNDIENDEFLSHEEEMTIELNQNELPIITTQEQRDCRCNQKQEIKSKILSLYKNLKEQNTRISKREIKSQISELKKELWKINSKIAHSYKQQFKVFFGLK